MSQVIPYTLARFHLTLLTYKVQPSIEKVLRNLTIWPFLSSEVNEIFENFNCIFILMI